MNQDGTRDLQWWRFPQWVPSAPRIVAGGLAAWLLVGLADLAQTVADALDAAAPRGPAAPSWIGLDRDTYHARLAELR